MLRIEKGCKTWTLQGLFRVIYAVNRTTANYIPQFSEKLIRGAYAVDSRLRFVKDGRVSTLGERNILGAEDVFR